VQTGSFAKSSQAVAVLPTGSGFREQGDKPTGWGVLDAHEPRISSALTRCQLSVQMAAGTLKGKAMNFEEIFDTIDRHGGDFALMRHSESYISPEIRWSAAVSFRDRALEVKATGRGPTAVDALREAWSAMMEGGFKFSLSIEYAPVEGL
jgi:hypothetical protein